MPERVCRRRRAAGRRRAGRSPLPAGRRAAGGVPPGARRARGLRLATLRAGRAGRDRRPAPRAAAQRLLRRGPRLLGVRASSDDAFAAPARRGRAGCCARRCCARCGRSSARWAPGWPASRRAGPPSRARDRPLDDFLGAAGGALAYQGGLGASSRSSLATLPFRDEVSRRSRASAGCSRPSARRSSAPTRRSRRPTARGASRYADYTASGRCLSFIEDFIRQEVMPFYANTHTETSGHRPADDALPRGRARDHPRAAWARAATTRSSSAARARPARSTSWSTS